MVRGHGQMFSMDLVIGVLIFLLAAGIIYSIFLSRSSADIAEYRIQSEVIATKLTGEGAFRVAEQNQLNMSALAMLALSAETDYEELKRQFGTKDDFCIYVQDQDGNLIYISDGTGRKYPGIGKGDGDVLLTESEIPCGSQVP